jgi:hypothetical protein
MKREFGGWRCCEYPRLKFGVQEVAMIGRAFYSYCTYECRLVV